jgi:quercetin dioxygenase-like cupin family protein
MNIQQTVIIAAGALIIAAALKPAGANARGTRAPADLDRPQSLQAVAGGGNTVSIEALTASLMSKQLPDFPGKEVVMMTVTYVPGHAGASHKHNAHGFIYVLEGSVVMGINGREPVTLAPGQTFYEGPNDIHTISRNASSTRIARFLVFLIKDKDAPIQLPVR